MELKTMKALALTSAVALGLATTPALAQTENVTATLVTSSAITTTKTNDMDFGEWLIIYGTDSPNLTLTSNGTDGVTQGGVLTDSQVVLVDATNNQEGGLTVDVPAPALMTMTASNFTDFASAGLSLDVVRYTTANETGSLITAGAVVALGVPVTVQTGGGTPEPIALGGTIEITNTVADNTHTADFDVTFTY